MMTKTAHPRKAPRRLRWALLAVCATALAAPEFAAAPALADPPSWAPAHGWRAKQKNKPKRQRSYAAPTVSAPRISLGECNRELVGGLLGGAAGALAGSRIGKGTGKLAATAVGTVLGMLVGGSIGRAMDQVDQSCVGRVLEQAPTGRTVAWRNPDNGGAYQVTPSRSYTDSSGEYCREYTATATIGGQTQNTYGTACRQPDGTWRMID